MLDNLQRIRLDCGKGSGEREFCVTCRVDKLDVQMTHEYLDTSEECAQRIYGVPQNGIVETHGGIRLRMMVDRVTIDNRKEPNDDIISLIGFTWNPKVVVHLLKA